MYVLIKELLFPGVRSENYLHLFLSSVVVCCVFCVVCCVLCLASDMPRDVEEMVGLFKRVDT